MNLPKNLKDIQKSRSRNFCQFLESFRNFGLKKKSRLGFGKFGLEKKSVGSGFEKFGLGKEVSFSVSENLDSEKKCWFQSEIWSRHSGTTAHIGFMILLSLLLGNAETDGEY